MWAPLLVKSENHKAQTLVMGGAPAPGAQRVALCAHIPSRHGLRLRARARVLSHSPLRA